MNIQTVVNLMLDWQKSKSSYYLSDDESEVVFHPDGSVRSFIEKPAHLLTERALAWRKYRVARDQLVNEIGEVAFLRLMNKCVVSSRRVIRAHA